MKNARRKNPIVSSRNSIEIRSDLIEQVFSFISVFLDFSFVHLYSFHLLNIGIKWEKNKDWSIWILCRHARALFKSFLNSNIVDSCPLTHDLNHFIAWWNPKEKIKSIPIEKFFEKKRRRHYLEDGWCFAVMRGCHEVYLYSTFKQIHLDANVKNPQQRNDYRGSWPATICWKAPAHAPCLPSQYSGFGSRRSRMSKPRAA